MCRMDDWGRARFNEKMRAESKIPARTGRYGACHRPNTAFPRVSLTRVCQSLPLARKWEARSASSLIDFSSSVGAFRAVAGTTLPSRDRLPARAAHASSHHRSIRERQEPARSAAVSPPPLLHPSEYQSLSRTYLSLSFLLADRRLMISLLSQVLSQDCHKLKKFHPSIYMPRPSSVLDA